MNVNNNDRININYSVFGSQLFSGKIKERWNSLTNNLENMIKNASGIEIIAQPSNIINLEETSTEKDKTPLKKIHKFFLLTIGFTVFSWFLPYVSTRRNSISLIYFANKDPDIFTMLILSLILSSAIIYLTFRAAYRIKTRIVLTFIFMLSQSFLFNLVDYKFSSPVFISLEIGSYAIVFTPIAAFIITLIEFIGLELKKSWRPKAITILGILIIFELIFNLYLLLEQDPVVLFWNFLPGIPAQIIYVGYICVMGYLGYGFFKLLKPAWSLAILFFSFIIVNSLVNLVSFLNNYGNQITVQLNEHQWRTFSFDPKTGTGIELFSQILFSLIIAIVIVGYVYRKKEYFKIFQKTKMEEILDICINYSKNIIKAQKDNVSGTLNIGEKRRLLFIQSIVGSSGSIILGIIITYLLLKLEIIAGFSGSVERFGLQFISVLFYASHGISLMGNGKEFTIFQISEKAPEVLKLLLIPVSSLLIGGFLSRRIGKARTIRNAFVSGALISIPYAILMVLFTSIFSMVIAQPEIVTTFIFSLIYGLIFGGFGGILGRIGEKYDEK